MAYSTVRDLDFVRPSDTFPDGVCDRLTPAVADVEEENPRETVSAALGSDSGFVTRSSLAWALLYCRQMSWKKSSWPSLWPVSFPDGES